MQFKLLFVSICFVLHLPLSAQQATDISVNFQAYPTGLIPGINIDKSISDYRNLSFRFGYNWFRHRDLGVHDDERGGGFGFTLGLQQYLNPEKTSWHISIYSDVWWNSADWYDLLPNDQRVDGNTKITVIQPTAQIAHLFKIGDTSFLTPSVSFGWEWNVKTSGEPTGEGAILLIGIKLGKRINK